MPSASQETVDAARELMKEHLDDHLDYLCRDYLLVRDWTEKAGMLYMPHQKYVPTDDEYKCVDYLCDEWDYGFAGSPPPK